MSRSAQSPFEKFKAEMKAHLNRWYEESDLDDNQMLMAINDVITECFDLEDTVEFESDINLDDEDDDKVF
tara:strand:+ start:538 stop:747 length:210 start_codon:yes stop_codon:yes gene_type:complete